MYARNVTLELKADSTDAFTKTLETSVLPVLRKQAGFKDEISLVAADGKQVVAISMWDSKENAERYSREAYPGVLKSLENVVTGTPTVKSFDVANSTFHKIAAKV